MEINGNNLDNIDSVRSTMISTHIMLPPSKNVNITFKNIVYSIRASYLSNKRKYLLKGLNGLFKSGELTAIMGPSGAGKSTLLNVLSGFIKIGVSGSICTNDELDDDAEQPKTRKQSAYIMQDDYFNPLFTVGETMKFAADVKLGYMVSSKAKLLLIEDILDSMAMRETKETLCGRLSGGQKKRLNVCLELINNPSVLFLDEPTSGLDSLSCNLLISKLKGLARSGRTVICTIHQPSAGIFSLFDHLYLMGSGKSVYQGDVQNILPFLECVGLSCPLFHNPADFVMDVICGEFGSYDDKLSNAMEKNKWRQLDLNYTAIQENELIMPATVNASLLKGNPSEWFRYTCLVPKITRQLHRDWMISYLKLLLHTVVGIIAGLLFLGFGNDGSKVYNNLSYFFVCVLYTSFTSMMPAALKFPSEILILKKEHFNNWYSFTTYYLALLTVHLPVQLLFCCFFAGSSYLISGQSLEIHRIVMFGVAMGLNVVISELVGLFMGSMKNPVNGVFNGSIILAILCLLSGFLIFNKDMPYYLSLVSYASFFRYAFEIIVLGQYGSNRENLNCPHDVFYCHFKNPKVTIVEMFQLDESVISTDLIIMVNYAIILAIITYYRLKHRLKNYH